MEIPVAEVPTYVLHKPTKDVCLCRMGLINNVKMVQTFEKAFSCLVNVSGFQNMLEVISPHLCIFSAVGECWKLDTRFELRAFIGQTTVNIPFHSLVSSFNCCQLMLVSC